MKRLIALISLSCIVLLGGCSFSDLFIDEVEVHNGLVQSMDLVLASEEGFYDEYWALMDGDDVTDISDAYNEFKSSVDALDSYFANTKFTSNQQLFVEEYNDYYKSFIYDYLDYAGQFVDDIKANGYTYESMESYFDELDNYTIDFVDIHNRLIGTINIQSDYATSGQDYTY